MTYVECQNQKWIGKCDACLRRCEGQRKWPTGMCYAPRARNQGSAYDRQD
jgi:hypothetical protein